MHNHVEQFAEDHRHLLEAAARVAGLKAPVAVQADVFGIPLLKAARRGALVPIDGVLVRDWDPNNRHTSTGMQMGMRLYEIEGVRFARVRFLPNDHLNCWGLDFLAVDQADYRRLYKIALRCRDKEEPPSPPPVLPQEQLDQLWNNTIGYLESGNLERIKSYGGRARRGVLLTGSPGNGKTMACRWIWEECRRRRWEWRLVTPDAYRHARANDTVKQLFSVEKRGIIFFDDMDLALRDRETVRETDD